MVYRKAAYIFLALMMFITSCTPLKPSIVQKSGPDYWPTTEWKTSTPEAQGMDSELLAKMLEEISAKNTRIHSVLVVRNGYMVTEAYFHPYTRDTKTHVQSVTKSVIGALVGVAIQKGFLRSEDEKLLSFFPSRFYANHSENKASISLKHLLSMTSGFPCQEFSDSGQTMEGTSGWVQYMLDLPVATPPGKTFGYCDGNPHLLSAILEKKTGMNTREFANQELFASLGIPGVKASDWWTDPQGFSDGGYGLHLRSVDLAKFAYLYLQNGKWDSQQILPERWVADSTIQYVQKPEGPGYGYLWTVYPTTDQPDHYAALGLGGQQIHIYPSKNLAVIVTAELETFMEAPEIERMLNEFILPAIKSDTVLGESPQGATRLQKAVETAASPVRTVPTLPAIAGEISGKLYTLEENPNGWKKIVLIFDPGTNIARVSTTGDNDFEQIGLDNMYRKASVTENPYMLRGHWVDDHTFLVEWIALPLGNNDSLNIQLKYTGKNIEISMQEPTFPRTHTIIKGTQ